MGLLAQQDSMSTSSLVCGYGISRHEGVSLDGVRWSGDEVLDVEPEVSAAIYPNFT
jgi:hypothetical protein